MKSSTSELTKRSLFLSHNEQRKGRKRIGSVNLFLWECALSVWAKEMLMELMFLPGDCISCPTVVLCFVLGPEAQPPTQWAWMGKQKEQLLGREESIFTLVPLLVKRNIAPSWVGPECSCFENLRIYKVEAEIKWLACQTFEFVESRLQSEYYLWMNHVRVVLTYILDPNPVFYMQMILLKSASMSWTHSHSASGLGNSVTVTVLWWFGYWPVKTILVLLGMGFLIIFLDRVSCSPDWLPWTPGLKCSSCLSFQSVKITSIYYHDCLIVVFWSLLLMALFQH